MLLNKINFSTTFIFNLDLDFLDSCLFQLFPFSQEFGKLATSMELLFCITYSKHRKILLLSQDGRVV